MTDVRRQGSPLVSAPLSLAVGQVLLATSPFGNKTVTFRLSFYKLFILWQYSIPPVTFYREGSDIMTPTNRSSVRHDIMTLLKVLSSVLRFHEISVVTT
jgi:hypothetical protein